jgi:4-amino-4-deoxy-L-arabinose transferase-like glycosyltransferase
VSAASSWLARRRGVEVALVGLVALAVLGPGLWRYSPVDPWETHYGEVGRMMRQSHDYVHLQWPGTNYDSSPSEGFRSKPVLLPWLIAAGMRAVGLVTDGGYSGEMVHDARTMVALRLPFVVCAVLGLMLLWWMLARLVSRRLAWLALLVVGSSPMFCLVARQAMPDMPLAASATGALSLFVLALEDGDRPCPAFARRAVLGLAGGAVALQAIYYAYYFIASPELAVRCPVSPALWLPLLMLAALASLSSRAWLLGRLPGVRTAGTPWNRLLGLAPITTMRQVYLLGGYELLGVSVLAKGPPGLAIVLAVASLHVVLRGRWRALYEGELEIKRGLLLAAAICLPWHVAMFLKDGLVFINQYLIEHIVQRGAVGVDNSPGTFEMYTSQLGIGMWLWAALLPAALAAALVRTPSTTREGRVRFVLALWAMVAFALFALVPTKFHHYILPAIAPLGVLVAFLLEDILARRDRLHPLWAAVGVAIALLVCRDLMHEPERWIEMFVFRYDRAWPKGEPWLIDPSDGFLALGLAAALAIALAATRWRRPAACALGPPGRRVFVITEAWRVQSLRSVLPSQRARDAFDLVDTTSNKFSLTVFTP